MNGGVFSCTYLSSHFIDTVPRKRVAVPHMTLDLKQSSPVILLERVCIFLDNIQRSLFLSMWEAPGRTSVVLLWISAPLTL